MSWYGLCTFCVAYFLAVATPGPGVAAVLAQGLSQGGRGAPAFIAGFLVGDLLWFFAAALGLSALAQRAQFAFTLVKYAGALYLLYLAYKLWSVPARSLGNTAQQTPAEKPSKLFLGSLTLTLSNPKAMIFFIALLPSVLPLGQLTRTGYVEVAMTIALVLPLTLGAYVLAASRARRWLRNPKSVTIMNRGSGTLMAAAAVAIAAR